MIKLNQVQADVYELLKEGHTLQEIAGVFGYHSTSGVQSVVSRLVILGAILSKDRTRTVLDVEYERVISTDPKIQRRYAQRDLGVLDYGDAPNKTRSFADPGEGPLADPVHRVTVEYEERCRICGEDRVEYIRIQGNRGKCGQCGAAYTVKGATA